MPVLVPLEQSNPDYEFLTSIENVTYLFRVRWNARAAAWYMDLMTEDGTSIRMGMKIVLGAMFGVRSPSALFPAGVFMASDMSQQNLDAGLDDMGTRIQVFFYTLDEVDAL